MKAMRKILREFRHAVIVEDTFPHFDLTHEPFSNEEHTYSAMGVIEDSDLTVNQLYETIASHMSEAERSLLSLGVNQEEYELMNVSDGELSEGESDSLPNSPPSSLLILSNESSSESPSLSPSLSPSFSPSDSIRSPRISTSLQRSLQRIPRLNLSPRAKDSTSESDEGEEEEDSSFLSSPESESNSTYSEKYFPSLHFIQYGWIESVPFWLPSFENAFQYSLPYVVDRLVDFMNTIRNMKVEISAPVTPQGSPVKVHSFFSFYSSIVSRDSPLLQLKWQKLKEYRRYSLLALPLDHLDHGTSLSLPPSNYRSFSPFALFRTFSLNILTISLSASPPPPPPSL